MILLTKIAAYERAKHVGKRTALGALGGALAGGAFGGLVGASTNTGFKKGLIGGALGGAGLGGAIGTAGGYMSMKRREADGRHLHQWDLDRLEDAQSNYHQSLLRSKSEIDDKLKAHEDHRDAIAAAMDYDSTMASQHRRRHDAWMEESDRLRQQAEGHYGLANKILEEKDRHSYRYPDGTHMSPEDSIRHARRYNESARTYIDQADDWMRQSNSHRDGAKRELDSGKKYEESFADRVRLHQQEVDRHRVATNRANEITRHIAESSQKLDDVRDRKKKPLSGYDAFMYGRKR